MSLLNRALKHNFYLQKKNSKTNFLNFVQFHLNISISFITTTKTTIFPFQLFSAQKPLFENQLKTIIFFEKQVEETSPLQGCIKNVWGP